MKKSHIITLLTAALAMLLGVVLAPAASATTAAAAVVPSISGTTVTSGGVTKVTINVRTAPGRPTPTGTIALSYGKQFGAAGLKPYPGGRFGPKGAIATITLPKWSPATRIIAVKFLSGNKSAYQSRTVAMKITIPGVAKPPVAKPPVANPPVSYANCTDVWNRLGRPIRTSDPGYSLNLDRDRDGIGCEQDPR